MDQLLQDLLTVVSNPYRLMAFAFSMGALAVFLKGRNVLALVLLVFALAAGSTSMIQEPLRWAWILAWLPAAMIIDHAAFLAMVRKGHFPGDAYDVILDTDAGGREAYRKQLLEQARSARESFFSLDSLALRYGLPAFLVVLVGTTGASILCDPKAACCAVLTDQMKQAAQLGLAGAYVYVLLYLGQRTLRHDITSGAAMWSVATLALGPILAAVTSLALPGLHVAQGIAPQQATPSTGQPAAADQPGTGAAPEESRRDPVPLAYLAIYFVAGLSPRYMAAFVQETVRRLLAADSRRELLPQRTIPLSQVRGITSEIEERLGEEGILDTCGLAMADPYKLMRATSFDKRQILDWIDQAILIKTLPESWQKLEALGITGAIDLASLYHEPSTAPVAAPSPEIEALAQAIGMDKLLMDQLVRRLWEDMQVLIVWTLYQVGSEGEERQIPSRAKLPSEPPPPEVKDR